MIKNVTHQNHVYSFLFIVLSSMATYIFVLPSTSAFAIFAFGFSTLTLGILATFIELNLPQKFKYIFWLILIPLISIDTEHIMVNNSHIDFTYSKFATSSGMLIESIFNTRVLTKLLYISTIFFVTLNFPIKISVRPRIHIQLMFVLGLLFIDITIPSSPAFLNWHQKNLISTNIQTFYKNFSKFNSNIINTKQLNLDNQLSNKNSPYLYKNIPVKNKPDVIVLVLEGISTHHVNSGLMPNLNRIFNENFHLPFFIANQVQTNRGLYSLLCGDYPNIGHAEAKADLIQTFPLRFPCLPEILKQNDYETFFMQSAPLAFMRKDLFAKQIGFQYAAGAHSYEPKFQISNWGIDDSTLLTSSLNVLFNTEKKKPTFLTMLTVGTHHPYITNESKNDFQAAIRYTDKIVGQYYKILELNNFFKKNLLIITSDEARPLELNGPFIFNHWGILGVIGEYAPKASNRELYSQVDLKNSILDLLGLGNRHGLYGKSFFRKLETPRKTYLGSAFLQKPAVIEDIKTIHLCNSQFDCVKQVHPQTIFSQNSKPQLTSSSISTHIKDFIKFNDLTFENSNKNILFREIDREFLNKDLYGLLGDFKTSAKLGNEFEYNLIFEPYIKNFHNKIVFNYAFYPCWEGENVIKKQEIISDFVKNHQFEVKIPANFSGKTICHESYLQANTKLKIHIKEFTFKRKIFTP